MLRQACSREDVPLPGPRNLLPCAQGTLLHWSPLPPRFCPSSPKLPASVQKAGQSVSLHKHTLFLETANPSVNIPVQDFPGGTVDKNLPANDLGIFHMPRSN